MGGIGKGGIFSFHMPFFFILSGMTSHFSKNRDEFIKRIINSFVHLIIPALILYFLTILYSVRNRFELLTNKNYLREILYTILFASGSLTRFNNITINSIGIPWFFFVLYFGKIIFDYLQLELSDHQLVISCMILTFVGIIFGNMQWLPFSLDLALAMLLFFWYGNLMKNKNVTQFSYKGLLKDGALWILTLYFTFPIWKNPSYMELVHRRYPLFPICYICAIAGTRFICGISNVLIDSFNSSIRLKIAINIMSSIGKNSIYILSIHIFDYIYKRLWFVENHYILTSLKRCILDIILAFFIAKGLQEIKISAKNVYYRGID